MASWEVRNQSIWLKYSKQGERSMKSVGKISRNRTYITLWQQRPFCRSKKLKCFKIAKIWNVLWVKNHKILHGNSHFSTSQHSYFYLLGWEITLVGPWPLSIHRRVKIAYLIEILESILSKQVSEVTLLVICKRKLVIFISPNLNSLFSSSCTGCKFGCTAARRDRWM